MHEERTWVSLTEGKRNRYNFWGGLNLASLPVLKRVCRLLWMMKARVPQMCCEFVKSLCEQDWKRSLWRQIRLSTAFLQRICSVIWSCWVWSGSSPCAGDAAVFPLCTAVIASLPPKTLLTRVQTKLTERIISQASHLKRPTTVIWKYRILKVARTMPRAKTGSWPAHMAVVTLVW